MVGFASCHRVLCSVTRCCRNERVFPGAGGQPEVVALGGYSGFFPSSSASAYDFAHDISMPGTIQHCNVHFSKDNAGFCIAQINLMNTTSIEEFDPKGVKEYNVYGQKVRGYFGVDYPANVLFENVTSESSVSFLF